MRRNTVSAPAFYCLTGYHLLNPAQPHFFGGCSQQRKNSRQVNRYRLSSAAKQAGFPELLFSGLPGTITFNLLFDA
ncbi:hypothetical protein BH11BAC1_BH11BAC1_25390 [soil metagenome]